MQEFPILVLGAHGLVGSAIVENLRKKAYRNILTPTRLELDLFDQKHVQEYFIKYAPKWIFLAAAKVGGILANSTYPVEFLWENLVIATNVLQSAHKFCSDTKLLFLGSSCIYPRECPIPIKEEYLLSSALEKTNEAYAISKIAGLKLAEYYQSEYGCNFFSAMPTNLYGPNDNYHPQNSHVIPGLIRKFVHAAKESHPYVSIWGSGKPMREFLYAEDLADALVFLMEKAVSIKGHINIGSGMEVSIKDLAYIIAKKLNYQGEICFDLAKPDGTMRKLLDSTRINELGWRAKTTLEVGLNHSIQAYIKKHYGRIQQS